VATYKLVKCDKCGKNKVVVEEDRVPMPQEFTRKVDDDCDCREPLKADENNAR